VLSRSLSEEAFYAKLQEAEFSDAKKIEWQAKHAIHNQQYGRAFSLLHQELKDNAQLSKEQILVTLYLETLVYLPLEISSLKRALSDLALPEDSSELSREAQTYLAVSWVRLGALEKAQALMLKIPSTEQNALQQWVLLKCAVVLEKSEAFSDFTDQLELRFGESKRMQEELFLARLDHTFLQGKFSGFETSISHILSKPDQTALLYRMVERIESWALLAESENVQAFLEQLQLTLVSSEVAQRETGQTTLQYLIASLTYLSTEEFSKHLEACFLQDNLGSLKHKAAVLLAQKAIAEQDLADFNLYNQHLLRQSASLKTATLLNQALFQFKAEQWDSAKGTLEMLASAQENFLIPILRFNFDLIQLLQNENEEQTSLLPGQMFYQDALIAAAYLSAKQPLHPFLELLKLPDLAESEQVALTLAFVDNALTRKQADYVKYRELLNPLRKLSLGTKDTYRYWALISKINLLEGEYEAASESLLRLEQHLMLKEELFLAKTALANTHILNRNFDLSVALLDELKKQVNAPEKLHQIYYLSGLAHLLSANPEHFSKAQTYFQTLIKAESSPYYFIAQMRLAELYTMAQKLSEAMNLYYDLYASKAPNALRHQAAIAYVSTNIRLVKEQANVNYEDVGLVCDGVLADPAITLKTRLEILKLKGQTAEVAQLPLIAIDAYDAALEVKTATAETQVEQIIAAKQLIQLHLGLEQFIEAHQVAQQAQQRFITEADHFEKIANDIYLERLIWLETGDLKPLKAEDQPNQ